MSRAKSRHTGIVRNARKIPPFRDLEIDYRSRFVPTYLYGVDHILGSLERLTTILDAQVGRDRGLVLVGVPVQHIEHHLGFPQARAIDVIQRNVRVA
jgi:hypothetical protein